MNFKLQPHRHRDAFEVTLTTVESSRYDLAFH